jgi:hypothetical protein
MAAVSGNGRRVVLVHWKNRKDNVVEIFSSLKNFCLSYPQYNYHTLTNYLSKDRKPYENDTAKIERMQLFTEPLAAGKPNLYKGLFWDFNYEQINWQKSYLTVMERVMERGTDDEWQELINFYGKEKVVRALKNEIKYMPDFAIEKACKYFKLKKEELVCYKRIQSKQQHWL